MSATNVLMILNLYRYDSYNAENRKRGLQFGSSSCLWTLCLENGMQTQVPHLFL